MPWSKEELEAAGKANCGCWYHAEQGIPCRHDLELLKKKKRKENSANK